MDNFIRDTLKEQMQILSERSARENGEYLAPITAQMIELAKLLDPELRSQSSGERPLPFVGHLSMSDLEELARARRELVRRSIEETRQFYKDLQSRANQNNQAK